MTIDAVVESAEEIATVIETLEYGGYYRNQKPFGEPMMSKRNLYPTVNEPENHDQRKFIKKMMRILNYSDGTHSIIEIAEKYDTTVDDLMLAINQLQEAGLLTPEPQLPTYEMRYSSGD
jgi:aminopeptidase-like protein